MAEPQGFDSLAIAMAMRDIIRDMIRTEVDKLRPRYQMAIVVSIDRVNMKCMVLITGDTTPIQVVMGSIQPLSEGQLVRIEGLQGDRFIADVMGTPYGGVIAMPEPGFRIQVGGTAPTTSTLEGFPLIWIKDSSTLAPVPVTPTVPTFDFAAFTVTAPTLTGVEYQIVDGVNYIPLVGGVATSVAGFTRPYVLTVRAVATPGYALTSSYSWTRLLADASNLTLYSSDGFAGTANARLAPGSSAAGRTLDNTVGGSATLAWYSGAITDVSGLKIAASGTAATKNVEAGTDGSHGEAMVNIGAANHAVECNIIAPFTPAHSRSFTFIVGATTNYQTNSAFVQMYIDSTTAVLRWQGSATGQDTYRTSATEAMILGTWKCTWVNKFMQITAPDGQVFGKDYSSDGISHGNWCGIGTADYNTTKQWAFFDWVKVYR